MNIVCPDSPAKAIYYCPVAAAGRFELFSFANPQHTFTHWWPESILVGRFFKAKRLLLLKVMELANSQRKSLLI